MLVYISLEIQDLKLERRKFSLDIQLKTCNTIPKKYCDVSISFIIICRENYYKIKKRKKSWFNSVYSFKIIYFKLTITLFIFKVQNTQKLH